MSERPQALICPFCYGLGFLLGVLGRMKHYRCRDCGGQWMEQLPPGAPVPPQPWEEEEEDNPEREEAA